MSGRDCLVEWGTLVITMHYRDSLVPPEWGKTTFEELQKLNVEGEFVPLKNTMHELKKRELEQLVEWICKTLPEEQEVPQNKL